MLHTRKAHIILTQVISATYIAFTFLLRLQVKSKTSERKRSRLSSGPVMDMIGNLLRLHIMSIAPRTGPNIAYYVSTLC